MKRRLKVGREVVIAFATIFSVLTAACSGPSSLPTASPLQNPAMQVSPSVKSNRTIRPSDITVDSKYQNTPLGQTPTDAQFRNRLSNSAILRNQIAAGDQSIINNSPPNTQRVLNHIMAAEGVQKPSALNINYIYGIASDGAVVKIPIQQEAAANDPDGEAMLVLGNLIASSLVTGVANPFGSSTAFGTSVQPDGQIYELGGQWWLTYSTLKSTFIQGNSAILAICAPDFPFDPDYCQVDQVGTMYGPRAGSGAWFTGGATTEFGNEAIDIQRPSVLNVGFGAYKMFGNDLWISEDFPLDWPFYVDWTLFGADSSARHAHVRSK